MCACTNAGCIQAGMRASKYVRAQDAAGPERDAGKGKEEEEAQKLRRICWKLLLGALSPDHMSWGFYARQQREWYADLSAAAGALCRASLSTCVWTCASLHFTFRACGLDERAKAALFASVGRLLQTLDLKQLASCAPQQDPTTSSRRGESESDPESMDMCLPLTARALPSAELDALDYLSGRRPQLSSQEALEWRAETFDMASIAAIMVQGLGADGGLAHEAEAFWCLHRFAVAHAGTGIVFRQTFSNVLAMVALYWKCTRALTFANVCECLTSLIHGLDCHLAKHDPELLRHFHSLGLSVGDVSRGWMRNLFAVCVMCTCAFICPCMCPYMCSYMCPSIRTCVCPYMCRGAGCAISVRCV